MKIDKERFQEWLRDHAEFAVDEDELWAMYDQYLDEIGTIDFGGVKYEGSRVLRELDPTAYRCGFHDWADGQWDEVDADGDWYYPSDRVIYDDYLNWLGYDDDDDNDEPDWDAMRKEES